MSLAAMSLLPQLTDTEAAVARKNAGILRSATAIHHAATVIEAENQRFRAESLADQLAVLNDDIPITLATLEAKAAIRAALNGMLDAIAHPELTTRISEETLPAGVTFDGAAFVYTAPVEEPVTDTEPEA